MTDAPSGRYTQVHAAKYHSCAVGADSAVSCWGFNGSGQLNFPSGRYTQVNGGIGHSCRAGAEDGALTCRGGSQRAPSGRYTQVSAGWISQLRAA